MIRAAVKKALVTAWSYSRWADYQTCPKFFFFKHVEKVPTPENPAMARGNDLHKNLENHVKMPKVFKITRQLAGSMGTPMIKELKSLIACGAEAERQIALTKGWTPTGWFEPDCWLRAKLDLSARHTASLRTIDYKSGQMNHAKHRDQLELFALVAVMAEPNADYESSTGEAWYIDHGIMGPPVVVVNKDRAIPKLRKAWEGRVAPMFADRAFKETPGSQCNWCPFSGRRGGKCKKG